MSTELEPRRAQEIEERKAAVNAAVSKLLEEVPDGGEEGELRIFEAILSATSLEEIDRPWAANGLGRFVNRVVQIDTIVKMPSDFKDGYKWYLVADGVVVEDGEFLTFMTSSRAIITQLLTVWKLGLFPAKFWVRVAEEPTEAGYYPQHLELYREYHTNRRAPKAVEQSAQEQRAARPGYTPGDNLRRAKAASAARREAQADRNTATMAAAVDQAAGADDEPGF